MKIRFKKLHPLAKIPKKATVGSAGFDLTAVSVEDCPTCVKYHIGIAVEIPAGFVGLLYPRSSIVKLGAWPGNAVGVIDSDYRGEITLCLYYTHFPPYKAGERVGQIIIAPIPDVEFEEADELSETARGTGGYGSTGK